MNKPAADFVPRDLVRSREHPEHELGFHELTPAQWLNSGRVLHTTLQPARDFAGAIAVLSFIRSRALSVAIPGAKIGGDHELGLAVDFRLLAMDADLFFDAVEAGHVPAMLFDKLNLYTGPGTFHAAHRPVELGEPRRRLYIDWQRRV